MGAETILQETETAADPWKPSQNCHADSFKHQSFCVFGIQQPRWKRHFVKEVIRQKSGRWWQSLYWVILNLFWILVLRDLSLLLRCRMLSTFSKSLKSETTQSQSNFDVLHVCTFVICFFSDSVVAPFLYCHAITLLPLLVYSESFGRGSSRQIDSRDWIQLGWRGQLGYNLRHFILFDHRIWSISHLILSINQNWKLICSLQGV